MNIKYVIYTDVCVNNYFVDIRNFDDISVNNNLFPVIIFKSLEIIKYFENNKDTISLANGHKFKHYINFNIVETNRKCIKNYN